MEKRVVLGLSDGVDSAVAAHLLQRQGYRVFGLYMDITGPAARLDAEESARALGIPLHVEDISADLEEHVCRPFACAYLSGKTPNPCTTCNPTVKIPALLRHADRVGAEHIATGHYVRCDGEHLYMGRPQNDQSYMLCRLSRSQIRRLLLPLGDYEKTQVRKIAGELGLRAAEKPDSRENCFIRGETYAQWIESRCAVPGRGEVLFRGRVVGEHAGIHRYTVGQRWPEMRDGRRLYVSQIDAARNALELALWEEIFQTELDTADTHWIEGVPDGPIRGRIRARHTRWETPECTIIPGADGTAHIITDEPLRAPAPGQTAALYCGDMLLGGGTIA